MSLRQLHLYSAFLWALLELLSCFGFKDVTHAPMWGPLPLFLFVMV